MKLQNQNFEPSIFESKGHISLKGRDIPYRIISRDNVFYDNCGKPLGSVFTYSYFRDDVTLEEAEKRPVIFAYNGGPGSSSLWLHMGIMAPRRVKIDDVFNPSFSGPFEMEDNPHSLIDICDVVMIDPVGTGYGLLLDENSAEEFYSFEKDAKVLAVLIENWLSENNRWSSPKYLAGESYGTIRSCVLANTLMGGPTTGTGTTIGISVDGIIMMGTCIIVNTQYCFWNENGIEKSVLDLPTMAATNWYHHRLDKPDLFQFIEEAFDFAGGEYLKALYLGNRMSIEEEKKLRQNLSYYTGLSEQYLVDKNYRIALNDYASELLKVENLKVGEYDSRYVMPISNNVKLFDPVADDAAMGKYTAIFRGAMASYAKEELGITFNRPFSVIDFNVNGAFKEDLVRPAIQYLQTALRRNRDMKVLITNGVYDLVATIGQGRYTASHLTAEPGQLIVREYPSGHMSYIGDESAEMLEKDMRALICG